MMRIWVVIKVSGYLRLHYALNHQTLILEYM